MNLHNTSRTFWCLFIFILSANGSSSRHNTACGNSQLVGPKGNISSPSYPFFNPYLVTCTWHILSPPKTTLKIHVIDFNIPEDIGCFNPPCCNTNWLLLPVSDEAGLYQQVCGNLSQPVITVSQFRTNITFHFGGANDHRKRSFHLTYSIEKTNKCDQYSQFLCKDFTCLDASMRCDGKPDCADGDDELHCAGNQRCPDGELLCGPRCDKCFKQSELCDGVLQCPYGEDEYGCKNQCQHGIACENDGGCYMPSQRCDGNLECVDGSDENGCPTEMCPYIPNKRMCRNGRCVQSVFWCDGSDDCGDNSDEESCLKNSVITVALMGALVGGLVLVLIVGCTLRYYSRRFYASHNYQGHPPSPSCPARLRIPHSLSLPALIDNEFFHREPPPVYSVAVGNGRNPRRTRSGRRGHARRPHHSHRFTVAVPQPKPPTDNDFNSSSSPTSEDSLLSTSNATIANADSEQLLSA